MTQQLRSDLSYIPALDGLRALAVMLVVLRHSVHMFPGAGAQLALFENPLGNFFLNGWVGVDLFFLLSGYLISRRFFSGQPFGWRSYLAHRGLRILPAYLVMLGLLVLGAFPFYTISTGSMPWRIFYHLLFLQDYLPSNILVVLWSLGVEEKFYLLCPLLLPAIVGLKLVRHQYLALGAVVLLGPLARAITWWSVGQVADYASFFVHYRSPFHACVDGLFIGVLIARYHTDRTAHRLGEAAAGRLFRVGLFVLFALMLSRQLLEGTYTFALAVWHPVLISLIMGMLLLGAVMGGAPAMFSGKPMRYIGRISYSVYLLHVPLIPLCYMIVLALAGGAGGSVPFLPYCLLLVIVTLLAASLMYHYVERPFLKLKKRIA